MKKYFLFLGLIVILSGCGQANYSIKDGTVISKVHVVNCNRCSDSFNITIGKNGSNYTVGTNENGFKLANEGAEVDVSCCNINGLASITPAKPEVIKISGSRR